MATKGPEKILEDRVLDWLNSIVGCFAIKINTVGMYDPKTKRIRKITNPHIHKGTSDILGVYQGRYFAIEVKSPVGKASADQRKFINRVIANGGVAFITNEFDQCKRQWIIEFGKPQYETNTLFEEIL